MCEVHYVIIFLNNKLPHAIHIKNYICKKKSLYSHLIIYSCKNLNGMRSVYVKKKDI